MTVQSTIREQVQRVAESLPEEGDLTRRIETQTAKLPSLGWMGFAVGSMVLSASLAFLSRRKEYANFVGLWAPTFLLIGIYNKLVKIEQGESSPSSLKRIA